VERNRVKRLLREAFAAHVESLPRGHDYVVVARPELAELLERDGLAGVQRALGELLEASGSAAPTSAETKAAEPS